MTPRELNPQSVQARLDALDDLLAELDRELPVSADTLAADSRTRRVLERLLTLLADTAVKINTHVVVALGARAPDEYRDSFPAAAEAGMLDADLAGRLALAVGQRNVLIHEYERVDLDLLADGAQRAAGDYRTYIGEVARFLRSRR